MSRGRPGRIVKTKGGKTGIIYNDEAPVLGKLRVHVLTDEYKETTEKLLCDPTTLTVIGYAD